MWETYIIPCKRRPTAGNHISLEYYCSHTQHPHGYTQGRCKGVGAGRCSWGKASQRQTYREFTRGQGKPNSLVPGLFVPHPVRAKCGQVLTCGTGAKSSCGVQPWDGSQPCQGCRSVRRSATSAGVHRASPCGQQTWTGSFPHGHNTAC